MLTVKLVEHDGHEQIFEVTNVAADPNEANPKYQFVTAWQPDGERLQFSNYGNVFVMNSSGQTVAKYELGYGEGDGETNSRSA